VLQIRIGQDEDIFEEIPSDEKEGIEEGFKRKRFLELKFFVLLLKSSQ
jgi:hypothetical protein